MHSDTIIFFKLDGEKCKVAKVFVIKYILTFKLGNSAAEVITALAKFNPDPAATFFSCYVVEGNVQ